ncbi:hypothetical protein GWN63_00900 [Candidatus Bathyarchaeota archaeon]|nr:hypothetical protein [Candidatus Bathyarchaeota archaeon]NIU80795.1 hypothetical protein [Candidatus Bathyarchaeota archaeon]NIV67420.1 hypothetical protein [Candidatus Bathyarchaeota archaeon]NIW15964.1 hypothetical protein [Candidatus Bathyarchaeota archaeon]NIW34066.1 hypothetical protein [Candidatus Bathyarchaeota archaeon]
MKNGKRSSVADSAEGATAVGIVCPDGVILASKKRASQKGFIVSRRAHACVTGRPKPSSSCARFPSPDL